jgi:thiol-disulfide isomerase/thioredoxin
MGRRGRLMVMLTHAMTRALTIAVAVFLATAPARAEDEMWRWIEEDGTPHYTNDKSAIPARYRAKATRTTGGEIGVVNTSDDHIGEVLDSLKGGSGIADISEDGQPEKDPKSGPPPKYTNDVRQVLLFGAPWCQPCLLLKKQRTLEQLVEANPGLKLKEIDADQKPDVAKKYGVTMLPTIVFADQNGKELLRVRGPKSLAQFERALLAARGPQLH